MIISEFSRHIGPTGNLLIPAEFINDMGLKPGDLIHIAYISKDGQANDYKEFLLSASGIDGIEEDSSIQIPNRLLEQADISADSELQIACFEGLIVICRGSALAPEDLTEILERLKKAQQLIDNYSVDEDLSQFKTQLAGTIQYLKEGGESNG